MKRLIVAYDDHAVNNFQHAPARFKRGNVEVLVHADPRIDIDGVEVVTNFDLLINSGLGPVKGSGFLDQSALVTLPRHSKSRQMVELHKITVRQESFHYIQPLTRYCNQHTWTGTSVGGTVDLGRYVVIKPEDGARGIGQYVVDTKRTKIATVLTAIKDGLLPNADAIAEMYGDTVFLATDKEKDENEGAEVIVSQGYIAQSVIPDIVAECRVLISPAGPNVYLDRTIRNKSKGGVTYSQATGADADSGKAVTRLEHTQFNKHIPEIGRDTYIAEINNFLYEMSLDVCPFGSVDLFITREGKWGIFEYCNQFGTIGYQPRQMSDYHSDAIFHWLDQNGHI